MRWGVCDDRCQGQPFHPDNIYNQAHNSKFWSYDAYDLSTWYDGFCHTFTPVEAQPIGPLYTLSFYLGHADLMNALEDHSQMLISFNLVGKNWCSTLLPTLYPHFSFSIFITSLYFGRDINYGTKKKLLST